MKLISKLLSLIVLAWLFTGDLPSALRQAGKIVATSGTFPSEIPHEKRSRKTLPQPQSLVCNVVGISDGDTLTCLADKTQYKVRLLYIDAPERSQAFGNVAKKALSDLVYRQNVRLEIQGNDRYQRTLAVVWLGNRNINLALVEKGLAWAYRSNTQSAYLSSEQAARNARRGLWRDRNPINPADWRKQHK